MKALSAILVFALAIATQPLGAVEPSSFQKAVERLRSAFERDKHLPLERDLYADNLFVSHNYEPGKTVDTTLFLANTGKELAAAKRAGISQKTELTRFLADKDTVVATVLNTGTGADGKPTRFYIAYFFTIKDGRVAHIETWYDRKGADDQLQSLNKEMKK